MVLSAASLIARRFVLSTSSTCFFTASITLPSSMSRPAAGTCLAMMIWSRQIIMAKQVPAAGLDIDDGSVMDAVKRWTC